MTYAIIPQQYEKCGLATALETKTTSGPTTSDFVLPKHSRKLGFLQTRANRGSLTKAEQHGQR
jgi:hypothetical protein